LASPLFDEWVASHPDQPAGGLQDSALRIFAQPSAGTAARPRRARDQDVRDLRCLMLLCQKTAYTGSGIVSKELVERGEASGMVRYAVLCGGYEPGAGAEVFSDPPTEFETVVFSSPDSDSLPFPIPGMSNEMPYPSMRFRDLTPSQVARYVEVWMGAIRELVSSFHPQLLHVHHLWILAAIAKAAADLPVVVSVHGTDLERAVECPHLRSAIQPCATRIERIICLTTEDAATVRLLYGVPKRIIRIFGNGFNERLFFPGAGLARPVAGRYSLDELAGRRIVLFVGKFDPRKGIEFLLRAFSQVVATTGPEVALVVAGDGPPERRRRYQELCRRLGLADLVRFPGHVPYDDVGALMDACAVFVLPSFREPFGLVVLEALASGCRVVVTDQRGPREFVPAGLRASRDAILIEGLPSLAPSLDEQDAFVRDLAAAMLEQLRKPVSGKVRERIARAVAGLDWAGYMTRLLHEYRSLLAAE
jgi:glycosyltransferase involved in cell wall biosynthesis